MAPVVNFIQNDTNFVKIDPVVKKIWDVEFWWKPPFPQIIEILKVCMSKTTSRISKKF